MSSTDTRRFEYRGGSSSKFWEISQDGKTNTVRFGRIGTSGQERVKAWPSVSAAHTALLTLVDEKQAKGYVEITRATTPVTPSPPIVITRTTKDTGETMAKTKKKLLRKKPLRKRGSYLVGRKEVHTCWYVVDAATSDHAMEKVEDGDCAERRTDYVDALGEWSWTVDRLPHGAEVDDDFLDEMLPRQMESVRDLKQSVIRVGVDLETLIAKIEKVHGVKLVTEANAHTLLRDHEDDDIAIVASSGNWPPSQPKGWQRPGTGPSIWVRAIDGNIRLGGKKVYDQKEELKRLGFWWQPHPTLASTTPTGRPRKAWRREILESNLDEVHKDLGLLGLRLNRD